MTVEKKVQKAVDDFDRNLKELRKEYDRRFYNLPVNDCGEVLADSVLECNEWFNREKDRLRKAFVQAIVAI